MKIAFAGTPEFAAVALADLHAAGHEIALVLTQPDRPAGRGMKLQASAVKAFAVAHGLLVAQPRSLRLDGKYPDDATLAREALIAAQPEALVVAAYGLILPRWALELPARGAINIHASLLPRWRGAAPIHRAIEAGDARTGITLMQMDVGLDTGDMLQVGETAIAPDDSTATLHDRLATLGGRLIVEALARPDAWRRTPQPAEGVTYAHKIEKAEAAIDWRDPADAIERRIRAFDPFPGALATLDGEAIKVWRGSFVADAAGEPGTVLAAHAQGIVVACGRQALRITELQRAGGRRMPAAQLARSDSLVGRRFATPA